MYGSGIPTSTKRISNREMRRLAQRAINAGTQATMVLLACIAQSGGEITITQGTLDQCQANLGHLDFEIVDGVKPGEFVVRMLESRDERDTSIYAQKEAA